MSNINVDIDSDGALKMIDALNYAVDQKRTWQPGTPVYQHPRFDLDCNSTYIRQMFQWYNDSALCDCGDPECNYWPGGKAMVWARDHVEWGWDDVTSAPPPAGWTWAQPAW